MKINFRGTQYRTLEACYKANKDIAKVGFELFSKRLQQGLSVEEALTTPSDFRNRSYRGSHTVEGVEYPNLPSIARAYGIGEWGVYQRYHRGCRGDDLIPPKLRKDYVPPPPPEPKKPRWQVELGGITYKSISEARKVLGVKQYTYKNRRRAGRTIEEALGIVPFVNRRTLHAERFEIDGEYFTVKEMAERFGIREGALYYRLKRVGMTAKEAVTKQSTVKNKSKE